MPILDCDFQLVLVHVDRFVALPVVASVGGELRTVGYDWLDGLEDELRRLRREGKRVIGLVEADVGAPIAISSDLSSQVDEVRVVSGGLNGLRAEVEAYVDAATLVVTSDSTLRRAAVNFGVPAVPHVQQARVLATDSLTLVRGAGSADKWRSVDCFLPYYWAEGFGVVEVVGSMGLRRIDQLDGVELNSMALDFDIRVDDLLALPRSSMGKGLFDPVGLLMEPIATLNHGSIHAATTVHEFVQQSVAGERAHVEYRAVLPGFRAAPRQVASRGVAPAPSQTTPPLGRAIDPDRISHFAGLFTGRVPLADGSRIHSRYNRHPDSKKVIPALVEEFSALGCNPRPAEHFRHLGWDRYNLVAELEGVGEGGSDPGHVLVVAHWDSFGLGHNAGVVAPGADDNASGMAAVLAIAEVVASFAGRLVNSIHFCLVDAEEDGGIGSWLLSPGYRGSRVAGVFCIDMIGYDGNADGVFEVHAGTHLCHLSGANHDLARAVVRGADRIRPSLTGVGARLGAAEVYGVPCLPPRDPAVHRSDHSSFHDHGYPAVLICEDFFPEGGADGNPNYHSPDDRTIDSFYAAGVASAVCEAVLEFGVVRPP